MSQLSDLVRAAVEQAEKAYDEAIKARLAVDTLLMAIPVSDGYHYKEVQVIQEEAVQMINRAWDTKHDLEELEANLQALESVRGE